ncbi:unnamed protein product [Ixodes pacificus]
MPSWEAFFSRIQEIFGRPEDRKATARKKLATRSQLRSEGYTSYIEDVLTLGKKIYTNMPETEHVRHVLKGIAEEAVTLFILQPPADVSAIMTICQSLEAAQTERVRHVLKGIAEEAVTFFILQPPADVSAIMTI